MTDVLASLQEPVSRPAASSYVTTAPKARILVLDPLRGIAACAVMWFHFTQGGSLLQGTDGASALLKASGTKGFLGVDVFFVISGFVLPFAMFRGGYRLANFGTFLAKRILRLDPPYLVALALTIGLLVASQFAPGFAGAPFVVNWAHLLLHIGYLNAIFDYGWYNPVFWTLAVEFQFYLLIGLIYPLIVHRRAIVTGGVCLLLAGLAMIPVPERFVVPYLALFALGTVTAQYYLRLLDTRVYLGLFMTVAALSIMTLDRDQAAAGIATAASIALFRDAESSSLVGRGLQWRPLVWLGTVSYSIYLLHVPVGGRIINLGARFTGSLSRDVVVLSVAVGVTLSIGYLLYVLVEKPSQRWSAAIAYHRHSGG